MLIIKKDYLTKFLIPRNGKAAGYQQLLQRLRDQFEATGRNLTLRTLIVQVCEQDLVCCDSSSNQKDYCLGVTANAALHLAELDLFKRAVAAVKNGFSPAILAELGRLVASGTARIKLQECVHVQYVGDRD